MRVRGGALLLVLGVSLGVAGCSAEAEPTPLPPVPSASPSPTPLAVPPEAMAETAEGASAFARHYIAVLEHALANADASELRALSEAGCGGCRNLIGAVEAARNEGQRVRGAQFDVTSAVAPRVEQADVLVDVRYERRAGELINSKGGVIRTIPAEGVVDAQLRLEWRGNRWIVMGFRATPATA